MDKLVIHKNQGDVLKCKLDIDGAEPKDTTVRLCLEFENNKNMFFYGTLNEKGECSISIPKLREVENSTGNSFIEVIADSVYFKVYEAPFELRNSVEVKMSEVNTSNVGAKIKLENITVENSAPKVETEVNPYVTKTSSEKKPEKKNFEHFLKNRLK